MKGLSPAYNIFSANHQDCLSTVAPNSFSLCQNIITLCQGIVVFLPSWKPGLCIQLKNKLPYLCTNGEDLRLELLNTSALQIVILSKNSINIFNHAIKDHIRMDMHQGKGIKLHRQPWICHRLSFDCLVFLP